MWYTHSGVLFNTDKSELRLFTGRWVDLELILIVVRTQKDEYYFFLSYEWWYSFFWEPSVGRNSSSLTPYRSCVVCLWSPTVQLEVRALFSELLISFGNCLKAQMWVHSQLSLTSGLCPELAFPLCPHSWIPWGRRGEGRGGEGRGEKRRNREGQGEREIEVEGREERTVFFLFGRFLFISLSEKKHFFSSEYDRAWLQFRW